MHVSEGILTSTGGMTRTRRLLPLGGWASPCVAGVGALHIYAKTRKLSVDGGAMDRRIGSASTARLVR